MFDLGKFTSETGLLVKQDVPGSLLTTVKIGGKISYLVDLNTVDDVLRAIQFFYRERVNYRILGAGSNLLIADHGVADPVIRLSGDLTRITVEETRVVAGGGASLMRGSRDMIAHGLAGLEFAAGIPGTFGAAVRMNAGAHGYDMSTVIESISVVNPDGELQRLSNKDLKFDYRFSALRSNQLVTEVNMLLKPDSPEMITLRRNKALDSRKATQPLQLPSFGSVFKNPDGYPAAKYIEKAGLKGLVCGGAQISEMHANWIVNPHRQATAENVESLIKTCQDRVFSLFKLRLETEVVRWY